MKAIIISDGEGTRLRPLTCSESKMMLPLVGRPILEHTLRLLRRHGICDVTVYEEYLSDKVKKHIKDNPQKEINISVESKKLINLSDEDTLIIGGGIITDTDLDSLYSYHKEKSADATIVTRSRRGASEYGIVNVDEYSRVSEYQRYVDKERLIPLTCFMGIMLVSKNALESAPGDMRELIKKLVEKNLRVYSYSSDAYIQHISDLESYMHCHRDFLDKKINLPFPCDEKESGIWISPDAKIMRGAVIMPPVYIGKGTVINRGARIESYSVLGDNVNVGSMSSIKRSIVMDNSRIGEGASLRGAILAKNSESGFESAAYEGSIIAENSKTGKHTILRPSVKIWPDKVVENECVVSSNIIWENTAPSTMYTDGSVEGRINREITPEFAALLGSAVCKLLGKKIAVSCDRGGYGCMIKNAIVSGIQSFGAKAYDLGEQPLPISRSAIRFYNLDGGIALSSYSDQGEIYATLDIINSSGANIDNDILEKLSAIISTGEVERADGNKIAEADYLFEYKLYYLKQLINSTTKKMLNMKLLIHCPSIWAEELLKSAGNDLMCDFSFTKAQSHTDFIREMNQEEYDFGVIIDYKCESLTIITKDKLVLNEFDYSLLSSLIIMKSFPSATIYTPISSPDSIDILAEKYGATIHRTKLSPPSIMNELSKRDELMYQKQFIYRFDAVGALIMLIDYLGENNIALESLLKEIPDSHIINSSVSCPASRQEDVLKRFSSHYNISDSSISDGIKIPFENGWVVIVPSRSNSSINVISHGISEEYARELCSLCTDDILEWDCLK